MPRQFVLECLVELPADAFEQAEIIAKMKAPWSTMVEALTASSVKFQQKSEIMDLRIKQTPKEKRPRKPRAMHPGLLLAENPQEAAE